MIVTPDPRIVGNMPIPIAPDELKKLNPPVETVTPLPTRFIRMLGKIRAPYEPTKKDPPKPEPKDTIVPPVENEVQLRGRIRNPTLPKIPHRDDE